MSASGWLVQNVAESVLIGPFLNVNDNKTELTTLAATMQVYLSKNNGVFALRNSEDAITYDKKGHYLVPLNAIDKNTLGTLKLYISDSTVHFPVWDNYKIVTQAQMNYFGTLSVTPALTITSDGIIRSSHITVYQYEANRQFTFIAKDANGDEVLLDGKELKFICEDLRSAAALWELDSSYFGISGSSVTVTIPLTSTTTPGKFSYNIRNATDGNIVVAQGNYTCKAAKKQYA